MASKNEENNHFSIYLFRPVKEAQNFLLCNIGPPKNGPHALCGRRPGEARENNLDNLGPGRLSSIPHGLKVGPLGGRAIRAVGVDQTVVRASRRKETAVMPRVEILAHFHLPPPAE
jgi:hypothetical protein